MPFANRRRSATYIGCTGIAALTNGQWNNLAPESFQNVNDAVGNMLPAADLHLVGYTVQVDAGTAACFVRAYDAHTPGAADATTNYPQIPAGASLELDCTTSWETAAGMQYPTGISVYKTATATGRIITFWELPQ